MAAFAIHVFWVAVDAVAALHLGDGGRRVGGWAQGVWVVSNAAAKLDVVLVPVSPQNRLDLIKRKNKHNMQKWIFLLCNCFGILFLDIFCMQTKRMGFCDIHLLS